MNGVTAIRTLKKINPQIRIIAISGLASSDKTAAALAAGVQTFLPKPYTSDALLQALYEVLHGNPANSANQHMQ
jgi:DNA-binding NarL/FixJ family response regulator